MDFQFTWGVALGAVLAFAIGAGTCAFDLYQTINRSDFQSKNLFKSAAIDVFILLNALISLTLFILTCLYPGEWVAKSIGQDISNPVLRGIVVGFLVTVIVRSQLWNVNNEKGAGVDVIYSELRTLALRRLQLRTTIEINQLALHYQDLIRRCPGHSEANFTATIISMSIDLLNDIHANDIARRDKILEAFEKATAAIPALPSPGDLTREGAVMKYAMQYCGIKLIKKDVLDDWMRATRRAYANAARLPSFLRSREAKIWPFALVTV